MSNVQDLASDTLLIGAHVSTSGGIDLAPKRAHDIGCNAVQIFCSSPRMWSVNDVLPDRIVRYNENVKKEGILATVIHAQYLVNLASDKPELVEKSKTSLLVDLRACAGIHSVGVVVHVGSHQGRGWEAVREQVVREIGAILNAAPEGAIFLIENSAGQNGKIASDLREIRWMLDQLQDHKRLGWCLDSCHAFAAGYPPLHMEGEKHLFDTIEELSLAPSLKVVHVNDSRDPYLSRKDRHANLLDGTMGQENLHTFLTHPILSGVPLILEVPGLEGLGPDKENVERLKKLTQK